MASARESRAQPEPADRAAVIVALERLIRTGEPHHNDHREGEWLQRVVNEGYSRKDGEIMRLAQRAAVTLVPFATDPVGPVSAVPVLYVRKVDWLKVPSVSRYQADVFASWDGGELLKVEPRWQSQGSINHAAPPAAKRPGFHRVRLQARIVLEGPADSAVAETRELGEIVYALYDPAEEEEDARVFVFSPARVSAREFDSALPEFPLTDWLNGTLLPFGGRSDPDRDWKSTYCDARTRPGAAVAQDNTLCTIAYFSMNAGFGELWFRTGRVERGEGAVRWIPERPSFQALRLHGGQNTAHLTLSALPGLLAEPPERWPTGDVSVVPDDIIVAPAPGIVRFEATVRNSGALDLHGVNITVAAATSERERGELRSFVRDIPAGGEARIEGTIALPGPYGAVVVLAMQVGEDSPHDFWIPDPTPDDAVAYRIVNPRHAPQDYAARIRNQCAPACRGY
jgi:hypothetical protein